METLKKYGGLAVATHFTMSLGFYAAAFLIVKRGVNLKPLMKFLKIPDTKFSEGASTATGAYVIYKAIMPLRLAATAATVPILASYLGKHPRE